MDLLTPLVWFLMVMDTLANLEHQERDRERGHKDRGPKRNRGKGERRIEIDRNREKEPPHENSVENTVNELLHRRRYAKSDPPRFDKPTKVELGIYVNSFYSISEQTMEYAISFYLRQKWNDPRLVFKPFYIPDLGKVDKVSLAGGKRWNDIWLPDIFFRNEKIAHFHIVSVPNRMLTLDHEGNLWYVAKISATLSCPMKLQKYPLDTQHCPIMFESFGYTMDTMYFAWLPSPVDIDPNVQLPQFTLKDKILYDCSQNYTAGAFPCLQITFVLSRDIGFFLIQVYVPTILIVILSWVSFWINVDAIPARVSLGLLTVLTMTTMSTGANSTLPRVSYVKAIDVWMSTCLVFVFAALLEFAVVNVISRKGVRMVKPIRRTPATMQQFQLQRGTTDQINPVENGLDRFKESPSRYSDHEGRAKAYRIDKVSRKIFPMALVLFTMIYWILYTIPVSESDAQY